MSDVLNVNLREGRGTRVSRKLRRAGRIPGILYGHGQEAVSVDVSADEFALVLRHGAHVVDLTGAVTEKALIKALQWDTYGVEVVHLDLTRVSMDERVKVHLAVELRGTAPGVREGGVILHHLHTIEVECPVISIPEKLQLNINTLKLGESLTIANLELPAGVKVLGDPEAILAECVEPAEESDSAEGAAAEPELIGRKAAEEDEKEEK